MNLSKTSAIWIVVLILTGGSLPAEAWPQEPAADQKKLNTPAKVEIGWVANYMMMDTNPYWGDSIDVAVTATDSIAIVGEVRRANNNYWGRVDTFRAGVRYRRPTGRRITTFVQGVAGYNEWDAGAGGVSVGGSAGVDVGLTDRFGLRVAQVSYDLIRKYDVSSHAVRFGVGVTIRLGKK